MKIGKKYIDSCKLFDSNSSYDPAKALELCVQTAKAKFDETIEAHIRLGVDSRHADQQVGIDAAERQQVAHADARRIHG